MAKSKEQFQAAKRDKEQKRRNGEHADLIRMKTDLLAVGHGNLEGRNGSEENVLRAYIAQLRQGKDHNAELQKRIEAAHASRHSSQPQPLGHVQDQEIPNEVGVGVDLQIGQNFAPGTYEPFSGTETNLSSDGGAEYLDSSAVQGQQGFESVSTLPSMLCQRCNGWNAAGDGGILCPSCFSEVLPFDSSLQQLDSVVMPSTSGVLDPLGMQQFNGMDIYVDMPVIIAPNMDQW